MARMYVIDAVVQILTGEGVTITFGIPGAAINGLYPVLKADGRIDHILARHSEAQSHMTEGYTRAKVDNIGMCLGTSGPAGTDMATGMYSAMTDSLPILCITGQVPTPRLDKEDFQGAGIASITVPVTKYAKTVLEPVQIPRILQKASYLIRESRPGPVLTDLPGDVQAIEIDFDVDAYEPIEAHKPVASGVQIVRLIDLTAPAERSVLLAGGGVIQPDGLDALVNLAETLGTPVIPTLMGWGVIPDDHVLSQGMADTQTSQQYASATLLSSSLMVGIGNCRADRMMGDLSVFREGRKFVRVDVEPFQIGRVFAPDPEIASDAKVLIVKLADKARGYKEASKLADWGVWTKECSVRKATVQCKAAFENVPLKPQRIYQAMNEAFGRDTRYVTAIGLSQIQATQLLHAYEHHHWLDAGQAELLGWTIPAAIGARVADPDTPTIALSGDSGFNFLIEGLAAVTQSGVPWVHVLVNNAYLDLIRQSQRAFGMNCHVQFSFENTNSPEMEGRGVDYVKVVEGLECRAIRVCRPEGLVPVFERTREIADELKAPIVVKYVLEYAANISTGATLDSVNEFGPLTEASEDAPTTVLPPKPKRN